MVDMLGRKGGSCWTRVREGSFRWCHLGKTWPVRQKQPCRDLWGKSFCKEMERELETNLSRTGVYRLFLPHTSNTEVSTLEQLEIIWTQSPSLFLLCIFPTSCSKMLSTSEPPCLFCRQSDQGSTKERCAFSTAHLFLKIAHNSPA